MKYIVVRKEDVEVAILFPEFITHQEAVNPVIEQRRGEDFRVVAAGFCEVYLDTESVMGEEPADDLVAVRKLPVESLQVRVWGESTSLRVGNRGEADVAVILFSLRLPTVVPEGVEVLTAN